MVSSLSRVFAVLLLGHMLLAQCVACPPAAAPSHSCCRRHPSGHDRCGKPSPAAPSCDARAQAVSFENHHNGHESLAPSPLPIGHVAPPALVPAPGVPAFTDSPDTYSSPPLFVLHASYLI